MAPLFGSDLHGRQGCVQPCLFYGAEALELLEPVLDEDHFGDRADPPVSFPGGEKQFVIKGDVPGPVWPSRQIPTGGVTRMLKKKRGPSCPELRLCAYDVSGPHLC